MPCLVIFLSSGVSVARIAVIWDPAEVPRLTSKLQRGWDGFGDKTITSPEPGTNPALGSPAVAVSKVSASPTLHLGALV